MIASAALRPLTTNGTPSRGGEVAVLAAAEVVCQRSNSYPAPSSCENLIDLFAYLLTAGRLQVPHRRFHVGVT